MFTLTTHDRHGIMIDDTIRLLSIKERERLQGFHDDWTAYGRKSDGSLIGISRTQRMKALGNAVTVGVVRALVPGLASCLEQKESEKT